MQVLLDGRVQDAVETEGKTLSQVLEQLQPAVREAGRTVVCLECDGRKVEAQHVESVLQEQAEQYRQVDCQTAQPQQLAADMLDLVSRLTEQIESGAEQAAEDLNQGRVSDAMGIIGELCRQWSDVYRGVFNVCKFLRIDPTKVAIGDQTAAALMTGLRGQLTEVKSALQAGDYVSLADVLSYELGPAAKTWGELAQALRETAGEQSG